MDVLGHISAFFSRLVSNKPIFCSRILIYQMGKVGSSTMLKTLGRATKRYWWNIEPYKGDSSLNYKQINNVVFTHDHPLAREIIHRTDGDLFIINLVRDMLHRNISAFFENITKKNNRFWCLGTREEVERMTVPELVDQFRTRNVAYTRERIHPWYDTFAENTGIDVMSEPFDREKGYQFYTRDRCTLMVIRLENLDQAWKRLSEYLGTPLDPVWENVGESKWYSNLYSEFKKVYNPSAEELEEIYNGRLMKHFYSQEEINRFKQM